MKQYRNQVKGDWEAGMALEAGRVQENKASAGKSRGSALPAEPNQHLTHSYSGTCTLVKAGPESGLRQSLWQIPFLLRSGRNFLERLKAEFTT